MARPSTLAEVYLIGIYFTLILCCVRTYDPQELEKEIEECSGNVCSKVLCPPVTETNCKFGRLYRNGSFCQCCDVCVQIVGKGHRCIPDPSDPQIKGVSRVRCTEDLECNKNSKICTDKPDQSLSRCYRERRHRERLMENGEIDKFAWLPDCDNLTGDYQPKQCKEHKCICVDKDGNQIYGQAERFLAVNMTCGCSRTLSEPGLGGTTPTEIREHCTETGDYEDLQCVDEICYCADPKTGKPKGRMATLSAIHLLECYKEERHANYIYLKPCENDTMAMNRMLADLREKGVDSYGVQPIKCDLDGSFHRLQCAFQGATVKCYCYDKNGFRLRSYETFLTEADQYKCLCARDQDENAKNNGHYPHTNCETDGTFIRTQCYEDHCICLDYDGDLLKKFEFPDKSTNKVNTRVYQAECEKLVLKVHTF